MNINLTINLEFTDQKYRLSSWMKYLTIDIDGRILIHEKQPVFNKQDGYWISYGKYTENQWFDIYAKYVVVGLDIINAENCCFNIKELIEDKLNYICM